MASTYANVTVLGAGPARVVAALGDERAFVADAPDGATVVFAAADEEAYAFGEGLTAAALSAACRCLALEVSVFEEQILQYRLFRDGEQVDIGIVPTPLARQMAEMAGGTLPEPDAARLVDRLGQGDPAEARAALDPDGDLLLATDRHTALARALGVPTCAVGWGYLAVAPDPDAFTGALLTRTGPDDGGDEDEPDGAG